MQAIALFCRKLIDYRVAILSLVKRSFQARFVGTGAGVIWIVAQPLATVFAYWMVFSLGFKAKGPDGIPFVVYFMTAFLPWCFFTEALTSSANVVVGNRHLVKKMVFPTETLPLVEILASTAGHLVLLTFTVTMLLLYGIIPGWGILQLAYAYICIVVLALGLGWLFAALNVFHRDIVQSLNIAMTYWFWATPIVWTIDMLPESWRPLMNFNPAYHIVESYRAALLYDKPVSNDLAQLSLFWTMTLLLGFCGAYVFRRLKPEFADMM